MHQSLLLGSPLSERRRFASDATCSSYESAGGGALCQAGVREGAPGLVSWPSHHLSGLFHLLNTWPSPRAPYAVPAGPAAPARGLAWLPLSSGLLEAPPLSSFPPFSAAPVLLCGASPPCIWSSSGPPSTPIVSRPTTLPPPTQTSLLSPESALHSTPPPGCPHIISNLTCTLMNSLIISSLNASSPL